MTSKISRTDVIKLIDLLKEFERLCDERDIKFKNYTSEQMMEFLMMYKAYKGGQIDPPPF